MLIGWLEVEPLEKRHNFQASGGEITKQEKGRFICSLEDLEHNFITKGRQFHHREPEQQSGERQQERRKETSSSSKERFGATTQVKELREVSPTPSINIMFATFCLLDPDSKVSHALILVISILSLITFHLQEIAKSEPKHTTSQTDIFC